MNEIWSEQFPHIESLAFRRGKLDPIDRPVMAYVFHQAGRGVLRRYEREKKRFGYSGPTDCLIRIYREIMDPCGHYVVGPDKVVQMVPENFEAWHAGISRSNRSSYLNGAWKRGILASRRFEWWVKRWPFKDGPQDLNCKLFPNYNTLGIELVPVPKGEKFPPQTLHNCVRLIKDLTKRWCLPYEKDFFLTHSDVHPLKRTTLKGVPWDPYPYFFDQLQVIMNMLKADDGLQPSSTEPPSTSTA